MIGPKLPTITMPAGSYTTQWDTTGTGRMGRRAEADGCGNLTHVATHLDALSRMASIGASIHRSSETEG